MIFSFARIKGGADPAKQQISALSLGLFGYRHQLYMPKQYSLLFSACGLESDVIAI
jgi:hypothetical protein